jgi:hypothetical protein
VTARHGAGPSSGRARHGAFLLPLCALLLCWLSAAPAAAQEKSSAKPYALIFGTLFDAGGHTVYGAAIKVRRADQKKTLMEALSDHAGEFAFRVPPGPADYIVWADIKPQKKKREPGKPAGPDAGAPAASGARSDPASRDRGPQARVHVENQERVDIGLHLTE